jgi:hypothetical protein
MYIYSPKCTILDPVPTSLYKCVSYYFKGVLFWGTICWILAKLLLNFFFKFWNSEFFVFFFIENWTTYLWINVRLLPVASFDFFSYKMSYLLTITCSMRKVLYWKYTENTRIFYKILDDAQFYIVNQSLIGDYILVMIKNIIKSLTII